MRYVYSLIRYVPDPARGEFVNVGAIAGSEDAGDWQVRQLQNPARARALGASATLDAVWSFIDEVGAQIDTHEAGMDMLFGPGEPLSEEWLADLHRRHRNIVQVTPPVPMLADSADDALDGIFDQLVLDPARREFRFEKKNRAVAALRAAYLHEALRPDLDLRERVVLDTGHHREPVDFAVTNGQVLQIAHAWSFQIPGQEDLAESIKAWGWTIADAQAGGGSVQDRAGRSFEVGKDVDVRVVYVPPAPGTDSPAFEEAKNVFRSVHATAVPFDEAESVARRAHSLLLDAGIALI